MSKVLELHADNVDELCLVSNALASPTRIQILKLLYYNSYNVKEIASALAIPPLVLLSIFGFWKTPI